MITSRTIQYNLDTQDTQDIYTSITIGRKEFEELYRLAQIGLKCDCERKGD